MFGPFPDRGPLNRQERWMMGVFVAILLGLFVAEMLSNYEPVKLSALLVILFWAPLLALHETGHAFVAAVVGWYVGEVVIGMGRSVSRFRLGSARVEIRLIPIQGFVRCVPGNLRFPHIKSALIYFAGPGIELAVAGAVLWLVGPDRLFTRSDDYFLITLQSLAIAAAMGAVLNLIPLSVVTANGNVPNDGLGIILSFLRPASHYAALAGHGFDEPESDESEDPADWWKRA
jgi:hypothetical protein